MKKKIKQQRGLGLWARFLHAWPTSTIGLRTAHRHEPDWRALRMFHARLRYYLNAQVAGVDRVVSEFTEDAKDKWRQRFNEVEAMMQPGGYLHDISDAASKLMENAARIAALLHHLGEDEGNITTDTLERAYVIAWFHITEFKRIHSAECQIPQWVMDCQALERYLVRLCQECWAYQAPGASTCMSIPLNEVFRKGPVRDHGRFAIAINQLVLHNKVTITFGPNRKRMLNLMPLHFQANAIAS
ncbi:DUF3987 domain-containing protein [Solimonas flava]|uniref:DUF3987 domain-containing protein n=1 Tax=Solimonas flava TaxID=415849 RepID=UPI001376C7DB|nr:DUF3987 domain-containing protein [Solimonas flava]